MDTFEKKHIAIIGFGYIGTVIGAVLADRGFYVHGIDTNSYITDKLAEGKSPFNEPGLETLIAANVSAGRLSVSDDPKTVADCKTFIITVGTPMSETFSADMTQVLQAAMTIAPYMTDQTLVMLKSTVPPCTTSRHVAPILREKAQVKVAFCPERLAEGRAIEELLSIPIVVGGIDEESEQEAARFWREALDIEIVHTSSATAAEMVKLADNLWIDLNIALAGELAKLSDQLKIDVLEVINAANTLPKGSSSVNLLTPSVGVGGYCLTKDPWFVQYLGKQLGLELSLPKAGRMVNDSMPLYAAEQIDSNLARFKLPRSEMKVAIMGIAFKNNTGDCRYTPVKPVIEKLKALGYPLKICDPCTTEHDNRLVTSEIVSKDILDTMSGAHCVAFLAGHDEFHQIKLEQMAQRVKPGALIFDGRMFYAKERIQEIVQAGMIYKGIGRQWQEVQ